MMPSTCGMAEAFAGLQMRYDDGLAVRHGPHPEHTCAPRTRTRPAHTHTERTRPARMHTAQTADSPPARWTPTAHDHPPVAPQVLGKAIASRMHQYATSQLAFCKTPPKGLKKPITLRYKEVLAKPMDAVRDIYKATGRPLSDAVVQTMAAHLAANKQHKEGRPDYSLAKFGLDKAEQEALFKEYIAIC
jgi:hypothetical protein